MCRFFEGCYHYVYGIQSNFKVLLLTAFDVITGDFSTLGQECFGKAKCHSGVMVGTFDYLILSVCSPVSDLTFSL